MAQRMGKLIYLELGWTKRKFISSDHKRRDPRISHIDVTAKLGEMIARAGKCC